MSGFEMGDVDHLLQRAREQQHKASNSDMLLKCLAYLALEQGGSLKFPREQVAQMDVPLTSWTLGEGLWAGTVVFEVIR